MLEGGNGGMTTDEYKTDMSLWCILAARLLAGNDLTRMDPRPWRFSPTRRSFPWTRTRLASEAMAWPRRANWKSG